MGLPIGINNHQPLDSVDRDTEKLCSQPPQDNHGPKTHTISCRDPGKLGWWLYGEGCVFVVAVLEEGQTLPQDKSQFSYKTPTASSSKHDLSSRQLLRQAERQNWPGFSHSPVVDALLPLWILRIMSIPSPLCLKAKGKAAFQNLGLGLKPIGLPKGEICKWPGLRNQMTQKGIQGDRPSA